MKSETITWEGPFVCVAVLKTEKALVPYVHSNDGYVDVIAVSAGRERACGG